jgi:hypothetical protein
MAIGSALSESKWQLAQHFRKANGKWLSTFGNNKCTALSESNKCTALSEMQKGGSTLSGFKWHSNVSPSDFWIRRSWTVSKQLPKQMISGTEARDLRSGTYQ